MNRKTKKTERLSPSTSIIKQSLKLMSWNIQSPSTTEGNKSKFDGFKQMIIGHDIVCLQETRKGLHLPGYRSFNNPRKNDSSGV